MNKKLQEKSKLYRQQIFELKIASKFGHLASCLSCVDIVNSLYNDPETYFDHSKDALIFSKAHGSPSVYPVLAELGYFPKDELEKYCTPDGILRLHSDQSIPGCHFVGGSLGNGVGYAAGLGLSQDRKIYVILGDAELYEGSVWETFIFIAHHNLKNVHLIVDRNGLGILGETEDLLRLDPLDKKFESFGFDVMSVDGHDFDQMRKAFSRDALEKPAVTIANTVKGKGVSYMEGVWQYHTIIPKDEKDIETGRKDLS
jgi:transketolase